MEVKRKFRMLLYKLRMYIADKLRIYSESFLVANLLEGVCNESSFKELLEARANGSVAWLRAFGVVAVGMPVYVILSCALSHQKQKIQHLRIALDDLEAQELEEVLVISKLTDVQQELSLRQIELREQNGELMDQVKLMISHLLFKNPGDGELKQLTISYIP